MTLIIKVVHFIKSNVWFSRNSDYQFSADKMHAKENLENPEKFL